MQGLFGSDVIEMVLNAGTMAKSVLIVLLIFSVISWAIIFMKLRILSKIKAETEEFLYLFWEEKDLKKVYSMCKEMEYSPVAWLFREGYEELRRSRKAYGEISRYSIIEELERTLKKAIIEQSRQLEYGLGFLATTGNTTPFIGLFGTVWGIMEAFRGIGLKGSASLAVVAPGISEALITTAAGLAAAIPAVIAFNYFNNKISDIKGDMETFMSDFLNTIERYLLKKASQKEEEKREKRNEQ
ncbi:MAG: protein TolQ [Deltaproteobacteria bacterium]|nr:MAG: protein TolQ [Deltaproteobacteria bacterium]